jgi:dTDP-4-dehydrorhamnose reductase
VRVLVTGAGGQLGTDCARHLVGSGDDVWGLDRAALDVTDRDAVLQAVLTWRPDVVLHLAAWTAVDDCEADPERAFAVNALGARWVAEGCARAGAHLVHVSTDYVFDGTKDTPYHEWDEPNPRSVYGASKLAGEREVLAGCRGAAVVRTSWVVGTNGRNMLRTLLDLRTRDELAFVDDQRGRPSFTSDLAVGLRRLAVARIPGTFHLTNAGETTWYGFARDVLAEAGEDPDKVRPIATSELDPPRAAARPANSVLAGAAWRGAGLPEMPHYRESLRTAVAALLAPSQP